MPDREPYLAEDGRIRIADPYVSRFGSDQPGGFGEHDAGTVGETRAFLSRAYGVPHEDATHYVIAAASADDSVTIVTCCDSAAEAAGLLAGALSRVTGEPVLAPESKSVIVLRDDLRAILADAYQLASNAGAFNRLAVAAGLVAAKAVSTK